MTPLVRLDTVDGVARVALNQPERLNAWDPASAQELLDALYAASADAGARVVLISGAGRAFSAGADIESPREVRPDGELDLTSRLENFYNPVIAAVRHAPKPVVAVVQGAAAGLGCSLALACDLVIAAESAFFLLPFVSLGLLPDAGVCLSMMVRIGWARTAELALLGDRLAAPLALQWGLINAVHPDAELGPAAKALGQRLAAGPTVAYASTKEALNAAALAHLDEQLAMEAQLQQRHASTGDYAEGVRSFKEKRPPRFLGH